MTVQEAPATLKCRYRLATGCTAEYSADQKQPLYTHEKMNSAHALHRVTLTVCPVCGEDFGGEPRRAIHLSGEHGVTAGSERRQELDAVQVKELYDARQAQNTADLAEFEEVVLPLMRARDAAAEVLDATANVLTDPDANLLRDFERAPTPPVSLNGHSPAALDLSAAQDSFIAILAEVEALRARVAELEPDAELGRQVRLLAARD